jgi:hypothetical protein
MATNDAVLEQPDCHWVCALGWCSEVSLFLEQLAWSAWFGSKSALAEDLPHVLEAIIEGLDDEVSWPDAAERATLAQEHPCIFHNCIGIVDIWERDINKSKDPDKEGSTNSGKAGNNTKKVLGIIDYKGYFVVNYF